MPDRYLDDLAEQVDFLEITHDLARAAGRPAREHGLRGHDAVHLAAGIAISDHEAVSPIPIIVAGENVGRGSGLGVVNRCLGRHREGRVRRRSRAPATLATHRSQTGELGPT